MTDLKCQCGEPFTESDGLYFTLVGFFSPKGHEHDDNCMGSTYTCASGHRTPLHFKRRCPAPGCEWRGKTACFCHPGEKVDAKPPDVPVSDRVHSYAFIGGKRVRTFRVVAQWWSRERMSLHIKNESRLSYIAARGQAPSKNNSAFCQVDEETWRKICRAEADGLFGIEVPQ